MNKNKLWLLYLFVFTICFYTKVATQNDTDCGSTFACFRYPSGCQSTGCTFLYKWKSNDSNTYFELAGKVGSLTRKWVAIGFSKDNSMGDDSVVVCKSTNAIESYYNDGYSSYVTDASNRNLGIKTSSVTTNNQFLVCSFNRAKQISTTNSKYFDLSQKFYLLAAYGDLDSSNEINQHSDRVAAITKTDFSIITDSSSIENSPQYRKAHGCLMVIAWIPMASTGILFARYYKYLLGDFKLCNVPTWFAVHRPVMICVPILSIVAFIVILAQKGWKWVSQSDKVSFAHSILGIICISFAIIQPFVALLRCDKEHKNRFIFNYIHRSIGLLTLLMSIAAMFLGSTLDIMYMGSNGWGVLIGWAAWVVILPVTLEILDIVPKDKDEENPTKKYDKIKTILLLVHLVVTTAFTVTLVVLIGISGPQSN